MAPRHDDEEYPSDAFFSHWRLQKEMEINMFSFISFKMTMALTSLVVAAQTTQTATVFWLHGRNNSSAGFAYLPQELGDLFPYVKWVLPDA
jgi:hypothetical protein